MSDDEVVVRVICLGNTKKLKFKLTDTVNDVIRSSIERFNLDPDIVDLRALDVYVPMPKSVWLDKKQTLKQADIKSSDTLMVQSKAASDQGTMTNKLNELGEHFQTYDGVMKATAEYADALAKAAAAEDVINQQMMRLFKMTGEDSDAVGPKRDAVKGYAEQSAALSKHRKQIPARVQQNYVQPWETKLHQQEKDAHSYTKQVIKTMNEQEKQKAASLKAAAKLQGDSIDAMMKALNEANESIIGMEAKRASLLSTATVDAAERNKALLQTMGAELFDPMFEYFVVATEKLAAASKLKDAPPKKKEEKSASSTDELKKSTSIKKTDSKKKESPADAASPRKRKSKQPASETTTPRGAAPTPPGKKEEKKEEKKEDKKEDKKDDKKEEKKDDKTKKGKESDDEASDDDSDSGDAKPKKRKSKRAAKESTPAKSVGAAAAAAALDETVAKAKATPTPPSKRSDDSGKDKEKKDEKTTEKAAKKDDDAAKPDDGKKKSKADDDTTKKSNSTADDNLLKPSAAEDKAKGSKSPRKSPRKSPSKHHSHHHHSHHHSHHHEHDHDKTPKKKESKKSDETPSADKDKPAKKNDERPTTPAKVAPVPTAATLRRDPAAEAALSKSMEVKRQELAAKEAAAQASATALGASTSATGTLLSPGRSPRGGRLALTPLTLDEALESCSSTARQAREARLAGKADVSDDEIVLAPVAVTIGLSDDALVLGRGGLTAIVDKQLSRTQARLARQQVARNSPDDCTGTGVSVEITQMGTNNTYLLPSDDDAKQPRFDATARARVMLGEAGIDCHEKMVVLRKGVPYSLRVGDIIWLLKDKYPFRVTIK